MSKISLLLVVALGALATACTPTTEIKPDPSQQGAPPVGSPCSTAQESASLTQGLYFPQANYDNALSVCVTRATDGWVDVEATVVGYIVSDAQALVVLTDHNGGPAGEQTAEVTLTPGLAHGSTHIAGSFNLLAGSYDVTLQVATCAPDASIGLEPKTHLMATARRDASVLP